MISTKLHARVYFALYDIADDCLGTFDDLAGVARYCGVSERSMYNYERRSRTPEEFELVTRNGHYYHVFIYREEDENDDG